MGRAKESLSKSSESWKHILSEENRMIFVTVGTHEQPFDRLIRKIDELKEDGTIQDDVIIQTGFSTYEPKHCQWSKLISYQQMLKNVADARIVITHGGSGDIIGSTKKYHDN